MNRVFLLLTFFVFCFTFSQNYRTNYKSSDLKKYEDSLTNEAGKEKADENSDKEFLKPDKNHVEIRFLNDFSKADKEDNFEARYEKKLKENNINSSDLMQCSKVRDSLEKIEFSQKIGNIPKPLVIKSEKNKNFWIILFSDGTTEPRYNLSISKDEGKSWKYFYTGLKQNLPYYFKKNSKFPLLKDENHIQIEAEIVKLYKHATFPGNPFNQYKTLKPNALLVLDLREITKDSDNDGINDIEEESLLLNPFSKDTDNDGIDDLNDKNPRNKSEDNDFTRLYIAILEGNYDFTDVETETYEINLQTFYEDIKNQDEKLKKEFPQEREYQT